MVSIINNVVMCGTLLVLAFLVLVSLPKSMLRCILLEIMGWLAVGLAALYVVCPIDIIPDFIPVAGWIDDGAAILGGAGAAIMALSSRKDRAKLDQAVTVQQVKTASKD